MTRLVVTGATGRMGSTVIETAADREARVVAAVGRAGDGSDEEVDDASGGEVDGASVRERDDASGEEVSDVSVEGVECVSRAAFDRVCRERDVDAVVDFTAPAATAAYATRAAEAGVAFVTGTTGLDDDARAALDEAAEQMPVLHASNFSRGIAAMRRAVRAAASALPGYDVEVTETHHAGKRDAPSGTAERLLADLERVRPVADRRHGRVGEAPREDGEIGVHARRAGDVTGDHEVLFAGDDQRLSVTHRAGSRRVFAAGALDAADWLVGRDPGRYTFDDVIGDEGAPHGTVGGRTGLDGDRTTVDGGARDETDRIGGDG